MVSNNIKPLAIPIGRRNAIIYHKKQRSTSAQRNHFPLIPACTLTIHKLQEETFIEVVYYNYEKVQSQQLVYVAISKAISIECLYIIPVNKHKKFYHGNGSNDRSCTALRHKMTKLRENPIVTLDKQIFVCINTRKTYIII